MDWNTEKYTEFRQQHEIKYRYYDNIQLDAEEFNLREQLEETKHGSDIIYYNIALAYFAALLVLPQVIDEKFGIDPSNLSALKLFVVGIACVGLLLLLLVRGIFMNIGIYKDKRYRLRLEILEREKRYRKVKK